MAGDFFGDMLDSSFKSYTQTIPQLGLSLADLPWQMGMGPGQMMGGGQMGLLDPSGFMAGGPSAMINNPSPMNPLSLLGGLLGGGK